MMQPLHCDISPVCAAPRQGCVCEPCATVRRGIKDILDCDDLAALAHGQRHSPPPRLPPETTRFMPKPSLTPAQAFRRIRRLEACLEAILAMMGRDFVDLNARGADHPGSAAYRLNCQITNRINRTLQ